jgi:integrase
MASIRQRKWTTKSGKPRSGFEVSWYETRDGKPARKKRLFTGAGARLKAIQLRGRLDAAPPRERAAASAPATPPIVAMVRATGEQWVRYCEREKGLEKSTWKKYEQRLEDHVYPIKIKRGAKKEEFIFGDLAIDSVTAPDVEALKDALLKKLNFDLASKVLSIVRMMMNDVVRRGIRTFNPAQAVRLRRADRGEDEVQIPSFEEIRMILKTAAAVSPAPPTFDEVWIGLTIFTGLRPSENRGLAIEDPALEGPNPGFYVARRADQWRVVGKVKTANARRFIPLGPISAALLRRWLLAVPKGDGFIDPERPERILHPLFPTSTGTIQSLENIYHRMWVPLMAKAGLARWVPVIDKITQKPEFKNGEPVLRPVPIYRMNCLRHFAASLMIDEGLTPKKVQMRMGHSSIQVTYDLYGHLFDRRELDGAEAARLEEKLLG